MCVCSVQITECHGTALERVWLCHWVARGRRCNTWRQRQVDWVGRGRDCQRSLRRRVIRDGSRRSSRGSRQRRLHSAVHYTYGFKVNEVKATTTCSTGNCCPANWNLVQLRNCFVLRLLHNFSESTDNAAKLAVTEGVFLWDGDLWLLSKLLSICYNYNATGLLQTDAAQLRCDRATSTWQSNFLFVNFMCFRRNAPCPPFLYLWVSWRSQ